MSGYKVSAMVFFLLATSAAAYSEVPTRSEEGNEVYSWPSAFEDDIDTDSYWRRNLLLYNLLKKLQGDVERYNPEDSLNVDQNWSELPDLKDAQEKRWVTALSTNTGKNTKAPKPRPQPKWKSKKGKGTPMLCYFKLCSFRAPI